MAAGVCAIVTVLLYRDIKSVGRFTVVLWSVVMFTVGWIVISGLLNFQPQLAFDFPPGAFTLKPEFFVGLGGATLIAMYDYGGYFNVCLFGGEVKSPAQTIPRSIMIAVICVAVLYLIMSVTIIGVVPWRDAIKSSAVVSDFIERLYGTGAAQVMTALILWTSFASVFAIMLGYSRVPYAAAAQGRFFKPFARLHPIKRFPSFSVVTIGLLSAAACLLTLDALVKALIVIQIMTQFVAQVLAVPMIRRFRPDIERPFKMWAYPLPVVLALCGWLYILAVSGWTYILAGFCLMALGVIAYLLHARRHREWPFATQNENETIAIS
ncbi:MAG: APC family permease [Pyrinomonadaceae bacterium]